MNFRLEGIIPSKKNSRRMIMRGGRRFNVPSVRHGEWVSSASWSILEQLRMYKRDYTLPIDSPVRLSVVFGSKTKRKWDLSNKFESIADLLVSCRVLSDDNYSIVKEVNLFFRPELEEDIALVNVELLGPENE